MKGVLLDTQAFLWWMGGIDRLGPRSVDLIRGGTVPVALSVVSLWEIAIKRSIGRDLEAPATAELAAAAYERDGFRRLVVDVDDAIAVERLPMHHRDPFDRLLVVQAVANGLQIMTSDAALDVYDVTTLPATV